MLVVSLSLSILLLLLLLLLAKREGMPLRFSLRRCSSRRFRRRFFLSFMERGDGGSGVKANAASREDAEENREYVEGDGVEIGVKSRILRRGRRYRRRSAGTLISVLLKLLLLVRLLLLPLRALPASLARCRGCNS